MGRVVLLPLPISVFLYYVHFTNYVTKMNELILDKDREEIDQATISRFPNLMNILLYYLQFFIKFSMFCHTATPYRCHLKHSNTYFRTATLQTKTEPKLAFLLPNLILNFLYKYSNRYQLL